MPNELTNLEKAEMEQYEQTISIGLAAFFEVGKALAGIRDKRLYRQTHGTFEAYCQERWGISRRYANYKIGAYQVCENLGTIVPENQLPQSESQARPMVNLEPEAQREAWQESRTTAPNGIITAKHVEDTVHRLQERSSNGMKQSFSVLTSSGENEWYTPPEYILAARQVLGEIDLDPASTEIAQQMVQAETYYTLDQDGKTQPWSGRVWLNPPFDETGRWCDLLVEAYETGQVTEAILLAKAVHGYQWFNRLWYSYPVCFAEERISFLRPDGSVIGPHKVGSAFFYFGDQIGKFRAVFESYGRVIEPD